MRLLLLASLLVLGCRQEVCAPGATQACLCAGGAPGAQVCADDGARWQACACAAAPPPTPVSTPAAAPPAPTKIDECNALIGVLNEGARAMEQKQPQGADPLSDLRALATSMDRVAARVAALGLTNPELRRHADDYRAVARETADASRALADAFASRNGADIEAAQARLERAVRREDPITEGISRFCSELTGGSPGRR